MPLKLEVFDKIIHHKRQSVYQIVGKALWARHLKDGDEAHLVFVDQGQACITNVREIVLRSDLAVPLLFQRSVDPAPVGKHTLHAYIYSNNETGMMFARPTYEFTRARFGKLQ